jgi:hypothetical protein
MKHSIDTTLRLKMSHRRRRQRHLFTRSSFPYLAAKGGGVRPPAPPIFARDLEERLDRTCC